MQQLPWEYNSGLSEKRLTAMANFIAGVRNEVIELHDEQLGDTRLALGMRAYECCRKRIISASKDVFSSWLSILTPEGRFTFSIANIPVRFTRNDPKYLPDRKLVISANAMDQMDLFGEQPHAKLRWFFVFDTHYKSAADAVYFIGYNELGEIVCQWQIPIEDSVTLISGVTDSIPQAVELDKPLVGVKRPTAHVDTVKDEK
jgi:hypothetical protein